MDLPLKKTLLRFMLETDGDDSFIRKVQALYSTHGSVVLQTLFKLLAGIDIPDGSCEDHWAKTLQHRQILMLQLARNVDITTALSDYLQTTTDFLQHPSSRPKWSLA